MMAFDEKNVWAVRRAGGRRANRSEPGVYASSRPDPSDAANFVPDFQKRTTGSGKIIGTSWKTDFSKRARAMLRAGDRLIIAGREAEGGFLHILSAHTGDLVGQHPLKASAVWDGLAAAGGRLYGSLEDGTVVCLGGQ